MPRLSSVERAERKMVRARLEAMSVKRLRSIARDKGVSLHGATTHITIVNTLMANYDKWSANASGS